MSVAPTPTAAAAQPQPSSSHDAGYQPPTPSFYPMPYPLSYPPCLPATRPASQRWSAERPHRYVVCRNCDTILLCLTNLPTSVQVTRHFSEETPLSVSQTFDRTQSRGKDKLHHSNALMWLRRPFSGLFRYDSSADTNQSVIPLACRACSRQTVILTLTFSVDGDDPDNDVGSTTRKSSASLAFIPRTISLSDAYGREISAAAEANGFWNHTPSPFAGRPFPQR